MTFSPLPFRWRLTIWYGMLLTISFVLLGGGLYLGLRGLLFENFEEQLRTQSDLALANIDSNSAQLRLDPVMLATLQDDEHFVRIFQSDGTPALDTGPTVGAQELDAGVIASVFDGRSKKLTIDGAEEPFVTIVSPIKSGKTTVGVLQVGLSRGDIDDTLGLVVVVLGVAAPIVLLIAIGGGYLFAGRAIAPVATIANLAAELDGTDLSARLNLNLPNDELGRLARTFDGMLERIERAFERQRRFTGDAAHELRTPLTMMRGELDLALRSPKSAGEYRASLIELSVDLERMTALVGSLLTLARADSGHLAISLARFDLASTIDEVAQLYRPRARSNGIRLNTNMETLLFNGDEDLVIQLLVNLIENAIAHTPEGGEITIRCSSAEQQANLSVEDTGAGIAPEHLDHIFDRFYRVDEGRARARGGTGLGLSICQAIAQLHGGEITVTSTPGAGTRFSFTFPNL